MPDTITPPTEDTRSFTQKVMTDDFAKSFNDALLKEGKEIYLSDYDTESGFYSFAYLFYKENFSLTQVSSGCQNQCNIFRLGLKN